MSERTISDLDVYQKLTATADALEAVAAYAASLVGETALAMPRTVWAAVFSAVYEHSLTSDADAA